MGKKEIIEQLRKFKKRISKKTKVEQMIFFGSRAIGKPTKDSDIDLIIVSPAFRKQVSFKRGINLYKKWDLDYPVDFLCYTPEEFQKVSKIATIVRNARKEGIVI
ncbi:MAG TPA: nucleotidyltransferase domain-containing protein [Candidatus Nanoarchaeia archaeon]|nr:nucleotidyltransferase domain-containing protein [Candidatus Nanoarchaeia archaeon]